MTVLIIIPILNPEPFFFDRILPLLQQQTISANILLLNSGAPLSLKNYSIIDIPPGSFNHADTRNIALGYAADFYLFMTQDAMPSDDHLIYDLLKNFDSPDIVTAYARQIPYPNADPIECFARQTNYPPISSVKSLDSLPILGIKTFFSSDSCAMYRGNYFRSIGGFTAHLPTNEDMEFAARAILAGKKVAYSANATVFHSHNFTFIQIWKRYATIGRFFAKNQWILEEVSKYKKAESMGIMQAIQELKHLVHRAPFYLPRSIMISVIKYVAFKYGLKRWNIKIYFKIFSKAD